MGNVNLADVLKRCTIVENEFAYLQRRRMEDAKAAETLIKSISAEDVRLLTPIVPAIQEVVRWDAETLLANKNQEVQIIQKLFNDILNYTDQLLKQYEDAIC